MNDTGDMDALAAEYVLGTLESGERAQALALTTIDPGFVEKIRWWERRLSELHLMVEPIEPDGKIWERIKPKLPAIEPSAQVQPAETPQPADTSDDATPSGVFDEMPTPAPPSMPAAPQLTPGVTPLEPAVDHAPATADEALTLPPPVLPPPLIPERAATPAPKVAAVPKRGHSGIWIVLTLLLFLLALALGGLVTAWRYAPDRLPPQLRPVDVMHRLGIAIPTGLPPRPPAPPESQYDE
jgi:hypothetical protein